MDFPELIDSGISVMQELSVKIGRDGPVASQQVYGSKGLLSYNSNCIAMSQEFMLTNPART